MTTSKKVKASFRLSQGQILELTSVEVVPLAPNNKSSDLLIDFKDDEDNEEQLFTEEETAIIRQEFYFRLTAFQSYSIIHPYVQVFLRFSIYGLSIIFLHQISQDFLNIISSQHSVTKSFIKTENEILDKWINLMLDSMKSERSLLLLFLMSIVPILLVFYGYLVAFLGSILGSLLKDGFAELEKNLIRKLKNLKPGEVFKKDFLIKELESASLLLDSTFGCALTVLSINFLFFLNFKVALNLSLFTGSIILFLIFLDEMLMKKRKFEIDSVFNLVQIDLFVSVIGIAAIFLLRFIDPEIANSTTLEDDLGPAIFLSIICIATHCSGCAFVYILRRAKPNCNRISFIN